MLQTEIKMMTNDAMQDTSQATALVRELIAELAPNTLDTPINETHRLVEDLAYHSLALMELAFTLEDQFGLDPMDQGAVGKIVCVGDVERYVADELERKRSKMAESAE